MLKRKKQLTLNQVRVLDRVKKQILKGTKVNVSKSMKGIYSPHLSTTKITKLPEFKDIIEKILPDNFLVKEHRKLFDQKRIDYFMFPKDMEDEEIIAHVNANGIDVITVRRGEKGKMAFYSIPDAQAITKAIDIGYRVKSRYPKEGGNNLAFQFNFGGHPTK